MDALRMRVKRGALRSEKGEGGKVYVWVNVNLDDPGLFTFEERLRLGARKEWCSLRAAG